MGLTDVAGALESPEGVVEASVRLHCEAVTTTAAAAPELVAVFGLNEPSDVDRITSRDLVEAVAERASPEVRPALVAVASAVDDVEQAASDLSPEVRNALEEVSALIEAAPDLDALRTAIDTASNRFGQLPGFGEGFELAQAIVNDGASTLYGPAGALASTFEAVERPTSEPPARRRRVLKKVLRVAAEDAGGAAIGAAAGAIVGGAGAAPGAVTGAIVTSGRSVLTRFLDRVLPV